ncbi:MAG: LysR family transcriptional regulator [Bdellovibrionota bacterium]|mgnify:CR=1 FL=1
MARDLNVDQIKKLWILDLIIRSGSLKKAALQAKVSPSAISQSLTALEHSTGKRLLVREKGSITPTQDALAILEIVRPAFQAFDRLRDLNHTSVPALAWLEFGTYESIAIDVLPGLVHSLKQRIPGLKLGLRVSRTANLLSMVRKGELCAALVPEVDDLDRFYVRPVAEDQLGLFVSVRHPIFEAGFEALEKYGVGGLSAPKDGFPRYYSRFVRQLLPIKPFITSDSFEVLRAGAAAGTFVAILPRRVARRADDLVEIHPAKPFKESGRHKLVVVSQRNCDRAETDFLADEAKRFLTPRFP